MAHQPEFSESVLFMLTSAMNWVIPEDESPGAGSEQGVAHLIALVNSLGKETIYRYRLLLPLLIEADLDDQSNSFAQEFIDHVRDVYYGYSDTGAWADIGFVGQH